MVDTVRSTTALQALLADNSTGDISPQDLRDFLVSAYPGHTHDQTTEESAVSVTPTDYSYPVGNVLRYGG